MSGLGSNIYCLSCCCVESLVLGLLCFSAACMHCLDIEPYFGDCLEPKFFEWSQYCGTDADGSHVLQRAVAKSQSDLPTCIPVQGRLRENADFWLKELEPSSFVADIVTKGYHLPFIKLPSPQCQPNHRSAVENVAFESAVTELVSVHSVVESFTCPIVCSPLSVVVNASGRQRLVLD